MWKKTSHRVGNNSHKAYNYNGYMSRIFEDKYMSTKTKYSIKKRTNAFNRAFPKEI